MPSAIFKIARFRFAGPELLLHQRPERTVANTVHAGHAITSAYGDDPKGCRHHHSARDLKYQILRAVFTADNSPRKMQASANRRTSTGLLSPLTEFRAVNMPNSMRFTDRHPQSPKTHRVYCAQRSIKPDTPSASPAFSLQLPVCSTSEKPAAAPTPGRCRGRPKPNPECLARFSTIWRLLLH